MVCLEIPNGLFTRLPSEPNVWLPLVCYRHYAWVGLPESWRGCLRRRSNCLSTRNFHHAKLELLIINGAFALDISVLDGIPFRSVDIDLYGYPNNSVFRFVCHVLQGSGLDFFNSKSIQVTCVCLLYWLSRWNLNCHQIFGKSSRCTVFLASNKKGWVKNPFLIPFLGVSSTIIRAALGFPKDPVRGPRLVKIDVFLGNESFIKSQKVHPESSQNFFLESTCWNKLACWECFWYIVLTGYAAPVWLQNNSYLLRTWLHMTPGFQCLNGVVVLAELGREEPCILSRGWYVKLFAPSTLLFDNQTGCRPRWPVRLC